jgi:hypothetical protein
MSVCRETPLDVSASAVGRGDGGGGGVDTRGGIGTALD